MRAEQRSVGQVANISGDYEVETGNDDTSAVNDRAWWNFHTSVAYDGDIADLDVLAFNIRTDASTNFPNPAFGPCFADFRLCRFFLDARNNQPNPTSTYTDLYQVSENPEFSWFTTASDNDANPDGDFDYDEEGAWFLTLVAVKGGIFTDVSICIHTLSANCLSPLVVYTCDGFDPPMDKTVSVKKKNRVLPLKMVCTDSAGNELTDADIDPPIVQVVKTASSEAATIGDEDLLSAGQGDTGNEFTYDGNFWQFNISTKNFTGTGTYEISVAPGGSDILVGSPTATFVIQ